MNTKTTTRDSLIETAERLWDTTDFKNAGARETALCVASALASRAKFENRELTDEEVTITNGIISTCDRADVQRKTKPWLSNGSPKASFNVDSPSKTQWTNTKTGQPIHCLARHDKLTDVFRGSHDAPSESLSLGKLIVAAKTGRWDRAPLEVQALAGNTPGNGSVLVPDAVSAAILDLARARTVCLQAGAQTVVMPSETLTIAGVSQDPTLSAKTPGEKWTTTDMAFRSVGLTAYTYGCILQVSNELLMDAPNISMAIDRALAGTLSVQIDRLALAGSGSQEPVGLLNRPDVNETGSIGAIDWTDIGAAVVACNVRNHSPNAFVTSPTIGGDLSAIETGNGTDSARGWLGPPPNVQPLLGLQTVSCPDASAVVGDFTAVLIGVRLGMQIQMSDVAGEAFERNSTLVRLVWRGDVGLAYPAAFHRLTGITT